MKGKGVVFTMDIMIGIAFVLTIFLMMPVKFESPYPELSYQKLSYDSGDVINALTNLQTGDIQNTPTVANLIQSGVLTDRDMNKSVLDLIGSFWYGGNYTTAQNISRDVLSGIGGFCFNLTTSDQTVYSSCNTSASTIASGEKIVSGYQVGQPVSGYIARAFATKTSKNNTLVLKGDIISSSVTKPNGKGDNGNTVGITYDLVIPDNSTLVDSYWYIEGSWSDNQIKAYINGNFIGVANGNGTRFDSSKTLQYLHTGYNNLTMTGKFNKGGYETGDDGSTHFVLNYSTQQGSTLPQSNDLHFANVSSYASIKYKKPVFVAGTVTGMAVNLSAQGSNATLRFVYDGNTYNVSTKNITSNNVLWNNTEILGALTPYNIGYSNLSATYFYFQVEIDNYTANQNTGAQRDIFNNSYAEVNYTPTNILYGKIDITNTTSATSIQNGCAGQGGFYRNVTWQFNSSQLYTPLSLDSLISWLYYSGTDPSQTIAANSVNLYSHPPQPLIVELARFGYTNRTTEIVGGINNYSLNFSSGYCVGPANSIVAYTFLVSSQVGYGNVFNTSQQAANDAAQRLLNILQPAGINASQISIDNQSVSGIQWLWGPSMFKIATWSR